jgi:hypothetical protein
MIPFFSKTYDHSTLVISNYLLSQQLYSIPSKCTLITQPMIYFTVKRSKNRFFSNMATSLSILFLLFGFLPQPIVGHTSGDNRYVCSWKNKKLFYNLDIILFLLLPKLKKSKEIVQISTSPRSREIFFFNLLNMYLLKTLDNEVGLITGFTVSTQLSNSVKTMQNLKFFQRCYPL